MITTVHLSAFGVQRSICRKEARKNTWSYTKSAQYGAWFAKHYYFQTWKGLITILGITIPTEGMAAFVATFVNGLMGSKRI
jgi:hypothetical protein